MNWPGSVFHFPPTRISSRSVRSTAPEPYCWAKHGGLRRGSTRCSPRFRRRERVVEILVWEGAPQDRIQRSVAGLTAAEPYSAVATSGPQPPITGS
jgi:hypothetical protein